MWMRSASDTRVALIYMYSRTAGRAKIPDSTMVNNLLTFNPLFCYKYSVRESGALPVFELRTAHHSEETDAVYEMHISWH